MTKIRMHGDPSRFRRDAAEAAIQLGFSPARTSQVGLVAMELATNLQRHAENGHAMVQVNGGAVELVGVDAGPGIDVAMMPDGASSKGSMGAGIGSMQRISNHFLMDSVPSGTAMVCRIFPDDRAQPRPSLGGVVMGLESESGDAWLQHSTEKGLRIVAVDGAGHGPRAAAVAREVLDLALSVSDLTPATAIRHMQNRISNRRGASIMLADVTDDVTFAGIGNIEGRWVTEEVRGLASRPGFLGSGWQASMPPDETLPGPGDLVLCSDGLRSDWSHDVRGDMWSTDPTLTAAKLLRDHRRGTDDAMAIVYKGRP